MKKNDYIEVPTAPNETAIIFTRHIAMIKKEPSLGTVIHTASPTAPEVRTRLTVQQVIDLVFKKGNGESKGKSSSV